MGVVRPVPWPSFVPEPVRSAFAARGVLAPWTHQAEAAGATIAIEEPLPPVASDRLALEQIFSILIDNALKYLRPGKPGHVTVRGRSAGSRVNYEVRDNGRGIDPKDRERVFELFRRSGVQDRPGEGIGLAAVRALVYRLGGRLTLTSALDQGSTFRLFLPPTLTMNREATA